MIPLRVVNLRSEPCDVRVDRKTRFGNPHRMQGTGRHGGGPRQSRETVIYFFSKTMSPMMVGDLIHEIMKFEQANPKAKECRLGCWCAPLPCHADVLKKKIEGALHG